jgi:hypothetical protein
LKRGIREGVYYSMNLVEVILSILPWSILIWNITAWYDVEGEAWGSSLIVLFIFSTLSTEYFKFKILPDYGEDSHNCDCFGITPNGKMLSLLFRLGSLILILIQIFIFLDDRNGWKDIVINLTNNETNTTLPDDFNKFTTLASVSSGLYIASGLILIITLCQCGKNKKPDTKTEYLRWGLHDLILGSVWLALSFQFHDVVDDYDDSHWRHLFSSMIVFHIIILLFDIMGNPKYQIDWNDPELTLWSKASKPAIREMSRFLFYSVIYYCILTRLHESDILLVSMTIDINSWMAIIVSSGCLILVNISEYNASDSETAPITKEQKIESDRLNF